MGNEVRVVKVAHHHGNNWTPEEDQRLLDLIEAEKSWVLISAILKRPVKSVRDRGLKITPNERTTMASPTPELPDNTPISEVEFPVRIRNLLVANGLKTVGEVRGTSDAELLTFQDCGASTVSYLRRTLGLPSTDGVRPG
jgi:DNA-directed RNA polymerase alpha subunit